MQELSNGEQLVLFMCLAPYGEVGVTEIGSILNSI